MNAEKRQQAIRRMKELSGILKEASRAYYAEDREIMSNLEYDALYDELVKLEEETQMVLAGSATTTVGYEAVDELPKEAHESPMLSLDKTKDREVLRGFIGDHKTLLSWKMDGLTVVLTYYQGKLQKAVTRGNGVVGEVITNNVRVFDNIPLKIPYQGELTLRGEAIITYSEFEKINSQIEDVDAKYKNPRNLCSGSVRQLNNEITAKRHVRFYAFAEKGQHDGYSYHFHILLHCVRYSDDLIEKALDSACWDLSLSPKTYYIEKVEDNEVIYYCLKDIKTFDKTDWYDHIIPSNILFNIKW